MDDLVAQVKAKWDAVKESLNERSRRRWAATEVRALGYGGLKVVRQATGLAAGTIGRGLRELDSPDELEPGRVRRAGAGRPSVTDKQPELRSALLKLVSPVTRGDPESTLQWTAKSTKTLSEELSAQGFKASPRTVAKLLKAEGYSLQSNRKTQEGGQHEDRDEQFVNITKQFDEYRAQSNPIISVDTKKKELVGNYKNAGREWHPKGEPTEVKVHDFKGELGRVSPYGVYDVTNNRGWMNVGLSNDTAEFAVESIRRWWNADGKSRFPNATSLLITADCGGSNGNRVRLWKWELQRLADELRIPIKVSHLPPGTSKWNKIEHAFFSFVAMNWRGKPLTDYVTVIKLISSTSTSSGLKAQAVLDENTYEKGRKITDAQMDELRLERHTFRPEWNYTIHPRTSPPDRMAQRKS